MGIHGSHVTFVGLLLEGRACWFSELVGGSEADYKCSGVISFPMLRPDPKKSCSSFSQRLD